MNEVYAGMPGSRLPAATKTVGWVHGAAVQVKKGSANSARIAATDAYSDNELCGSHPTLASTPCRRVAAALAKVERPPAFVRTTISFSVSTKKAAIVPRSVFDAASLAPIS